MGDESEKSGRAEAVWGAEGSATSTFKAARVLPIESAFPPAALPTIYADGIANVAPSVNVVKFYLYRTDPEQTGQSDYKNQIFAQMVMPMAGFVQTAVFFEKALKHFLSQGNITPELIAAARKGEDVE